MKLLSKEEIKEINDKLKGSSIFSWSIIDEIVNKEIDKQISEKVIMDMCGLEYCTKCNWIVSLYDGAEYNDKNEILCHECYEFENKDDIK